MLAHEAQRAVASLFAKFPNPKQPSEEGLAEWCKLAGEFTREDWDAASTLHFRTNKYASPNAGEMYAICQRVRAERKDAERWRVAVPMQESEAQQRSKADLHQADTMHEWLPRMSDAELEALRDDFVQVRGRIGRDMLTLHRRERRDAMAESRKAVTVGEPRLLVASEIRGEVFIACMLRGHEELQSGAAL